MAVPLETIFGSEMVSYGTDNGSEMVSFQGAQNCLYRLSSKTNSDIASTVLGSTVLSSTLF